MKSSNWTSAEIDRVYPDPNSPVRQAIVAMMSTWQRMVLFGLKSHEERQEVVDGIVALIAHRPIPESRGDRSSTPTRVWAPAHLYYRVSSIARVRPDYDSSDQGWKVNAREGRIVGVRGGYMIVRFDTSIEGAPSEFRGRPHDIEVDISHINPQPKIDGK